VSAGFHQGKHIDQFRKRRRFAALGSGKLPRPILPIE